MGQRDAEEETPGVTLDAIVAHGRGRDDSGSPADEAFLRCYYAHVAAEDLKERTVADWYGAARAHAMLARDWVTGTTSMRLANPTVDVDGWASDRTIVMIVTDDLPFLVDSVTMELSRLQLGIHLVVHPILADRRAEGEGFTDPRDDTTGAGAKCSLIAVEIDRHSEASDLADIEENLRRVLRDVRVAVEDWASMRQRMSDIADQLGSEPVPVDAAEVAETAELLRWLVDDHFVFLGYREYRLDESILSAVPASGLGILRMDPEAPVVGRDLATMAPQVRDSAVKPVLLNITKASSRATVHRAAYLDYIGVKTFDAAGNVTGERRFLGLYTVEAYAQSPREIPRLRRLLAEVVERAGYPPGGHDEKALITILEDYPRDELLQIGVDELATTAHAIASLQERRRVRVFARREVFGRFVTCIVYLPRDRYNTQNRTAIQDLLVDAFGGTGADWSTQISEKVLLRTLFHIPVDPTLDKTPDVSTLETEIEELLRDWSDGFAEALLVERGEEVGERLLRVYADAFSADYQGAFAAGTAVTDVEQMERLDDDGELRSLVHRAPEHPPGVFNLKLYRRGERVSLTSVMPSLTNLGVTVLDERPYEVRPAGQESVWIYDFALEYPDLRLDFDEVSALLELTFGAVWRGEVTDDGFNRLVLGAGMAPREVWILRAYSRYLHQTRVTQSQRFIEQTLVEHADAARQLVDLFLVRFDPDGHDRDAAAAQITESFFAIVEGISSLDQDRVLRRFHNLIDATLRTNCFQRIDGEPPPYLAFKLDPTKIDDLPEPRPRYEIYVYSPRFEGVHLRAGSVARGGLRWSDRLEDYRTEILGLVKAQMVKNAVIVPAGAKGGFVLKRPPRGADPAALRDEVVACYRLFVGALLDLTDNLVGSDVVPPERTIRYDGDDTYLVVAADKGTATFSDIANELATDRGMWLGDAFASGGSHGYDHKAMGITARGGWESVKRHFRELGRDIELDRFTAVGIGDMSGDVFGNAMLLSPHTRLIAAFDHRHVFVDPSPDPTPSHGERARLFALPRSSWADYDPELISAGGGVYPRDIKSIELSDQARAALGTDAESLTPDELISVVLRAPVDLLWNGGIGTYVKATDESHADVGDKANDAIRVNGRDLRVKILGEGGNLGVTQRGRIEFAAAGGRIYTDAIDNAAGVDCSDHEVNIKILLDQVVAAGGLTVDERNDFLAAMTDEVATLVLANNYNQTQALSTARSEASSMADVHARYMSGLESRGLLNRDLERLPDAETMADRRQAGLGLTTPELAVLLAYTKNILDSDLLASAVPDDEVFEALLIDYFPKPMHERFGDQILAHRLRREIIANRISNQVVDRGGTSMIYRLTQETSAASHHVAAAHMAAWEIFQLDDLSRCVNELESVLTSERQLAIHLAGRQLAERATRLLVRSRPYPFSAGAAIADLAGPVQQTLLHLPDHLAGTDRRDFGLAVKELSAAGMPEDMARRVASLSASLAALDIVEVAGSSGVDAATVAAAHFSIADQLDLLWLRDRVLDLPRDTQWSSLARLDLRGDLYADHRALTAQVVSSSDGPATRRDGADAVSTWLAIHEAPVRHYRDTIAEIRAAGPTDLTTLLVASREVRTLIARTS
jgi:glutamate dehydrogenase